MNTFNSLLYAHVIGLIRNAALRRARKPFQRNQLFSRCSVYHARSSSHNGTSLSIKTFNCLLYPNVIESDPVRRLENVVIHEMNITCIQSTEYEPADIYRRDIPSSVSQVGREKSRALLAALGEVLNLQKPPVSENPRWIDLMTTCASSRGVHSLASSQNSANKRSPLSTASCWQHVGGYRAY